MSLEFFISKVRSNKIIFKITGASKLDCTFHILFKSKGLFLAKLRVEKSDSGWSGFWGWKDNLLLGPEC